MVKPRDHPTTTPRPPHDLDAGVTVVDSGGHVIPEVSRFFPMTRARWIGLGILALLVALLPFVPRGGGGEDGTARRAGAHRVTPASALTAGYGRVTPAYRRAIQHVVDTGLGQVRVAPSATPRTLVDHVVRCATFEGQRYCLGQGWTDLTQTQVQRRTTLLVTRQESRAGSPVIGRPTGDLSTFDALRRAARLSPQA